MSKWTKHYKEHVSYTNIYTVYFTQISDYEVIVLSPMPTDTVKFMTTFIVTPWSIKHAGPSLTTLKQSYTYSYDKATKNHLQESNYLKNLKGL